MSCHQLIEIRKQVKGVIGEERGKLTGDNAVVIAEKGDIPPGDIQETESGPPCIVFVPGGS